METETTFGYYNETYQLPDSSYVNVEILDTGGQEIYNSINRQYYLIADCCLLVYDITNKESFKEISNYYLQQIKDNCKEGIKIILLGNKTDLNEERVVSQEEAINLAVNEEYIYKETSCVLNENVADAFETIIEMWNIHNKKKNQTTIIKKSKSKENLERDKPSDSFALSDRNFSINKNYKLKSDNEDKIRLNKKNAKKNTKMRSFC